MIDLKRILFFACLLLTFCACGQKTPPAVDLDLYSDRGFAVKMEEIFADPSAYEGAAVRLTGQYYASEDYAYILRTTPDGTTCGFELAWAGEKPESGQWVLAVGRIKSYMEGGRRYLQLCAEQLYETGRSEERIEISENAFLTDLAQLYETAGEHLGARVTLTGLGGGGYVYRTAEYLDGRAGPVGLEFLSLSEVPEEGTWITVTGTLSAYEREGETVLTLIDGYITAAEPAQEPIKETP